jgi:dihydrofolate reductase
MRRVASFIVTSLDGFYEGPNAEFDWPIVDDEFRQFAIRQLDDAGTLGFGRVTYDHMADYWPTVQAEGNDPAIASRMNSKPKLVFSAAIGQASWSNTTVIDGDALEQIEEVKAASGGDLLLIGSAHLTASFAAAGVLDELRIMVSPIALGQGRSLFEGLKERVALELIDVKKFDSGNVLLTYRPSLRAR